MAISHFGEDLRECAIGGGGGEDAGSRRVDHDYGFARSRGGGRRIHGIIVVEDRAERFDGGVAH